jgi:hypothetical protein
LAPVTRTVWPVMSMFMRGVFLVVDGRPGSLRWPGVGYARTSR